VELPRLEPLYQKYRDQGFRVVALEATRDRERAASFRQENGLSYPMLETGEGDADVVREIFGVGTFPTSYLIDADGRILYAHVGFQEGDEMHLEEEVRQVIGP